MNIIVTGSPYFDDYILLDKTLREFTFFMRPRMDVVICSPHQKHNNADRLGEFWAFKAMVRKILLFHEGVTPMIRASDALIAFWNGIEEDTLNMVQLAKRHCLTTKVVPY